jgi:hypothetical protein
MSGKNYQDQLLTNIAKGYRPRFHINELIMPPLLVNKPTGKIADYGGHNMRIVSTIKAPEGGTPTITSNVSQADAYTLEEHALKAMASDKAAENQEAPFDEQKDKTELVMDLLSISREYGLANFMNTVGNFTNYVTKSGTDQWGESSDAPITDVETAITACASAMNVPRSMVTLVFGRAAWDKFVSLSEVSDLFKYTSFAYISEEMIAKRLGIKQVLVGLGRYNTAALGQTDAYGDLWGKHCWAVYIPQSPQLKEHCFGYTVKRRTGPVVDKWRDEDVKGWWVRSTDEYDQYVLNEKGVYMIDAAVE